MTQEKITRADIEKIKREHILDNLLYSPQEVSAVLCVSVRTVFNLIEAGLLPRANEHKGSGRTRIPARGLEKYKKSICGESENS